MLILSPLLEKVKLLNSNISEKILKEDLLLLLSDQMNTRHFGLSKEMIQVKIFTNADLITEVLLAMLKITQVWPLLIIVSGSEDSLLQKKKLEIDLWLKWEKKLLNCSLKR